MKNITPIPLTLLVLASFQANAAPTTTNPPTTVTAAGSGYSTFVGDSYINLGAALEPMKMADMLLCVVSASGASLLPNDTYQAIADFNLCGTDNASTQATYSSVTVESSRASADVAQVANMWIHLKDGPSSPVMDVHFKAQLSSSPTATNHLGVWQLDWEFQNPAGANTWENGHMKSVTGAGGFAEFTMASNSALPGDPANDVYAKIAMTSAKEGVGRVSTSNPVKDYAMAFNDTLVTIKEGSNTPTCQSIQDFTDSVYQYNLYDSLGALVDINAEIEFTTAAGNSGVLGQYSYWNGTSEQTGYWAWIEGNGYPITDGATTVSDSTTPATKYTITWDITGSGSTAYQTVMAVADGASAGGSAHVFDKPIIFDTSSAALATTVSPLTDRNDNTDTITTADLSSQLMYNGPGRLWGFDWDSNKPKAALADGTALLSKATGNDTVHTSKTYYVKAATVEKTPDDTPISNCASLSGSLASASALGLPTVADITNNPVTLGTEPDVTGEPKIKDGVLTN